jgi:hypothetical protein
MPLSTPPAVLVPSPSPSAKMDRHPNTCRRRYGVAGTQGWAPVGWSRWPAAPRGANSAPSAAPRPRPADRQDASNILWGRLVRTGGPKPASSFVGLLSDRWMLVRKVPCRRLPAEGGGLDCLAADIRSGLRRNVLLDVRLVVVPHPLMVVGDRDAGPPLGGTRAAGAWWACHPVRVADSGCGSPTLPSSQIEADGKISLNWPGIALFLAEKPGFWENLILGGLGISSLADRHLLALNVTHAAPTQP